MEKFYAIDTETYYDKTVSVKTYGAEAYTRHPDYYCGMVSIVGPDVRFVGKPADAPWHKLGGATWVAHNVQFDRWVINRMRQTGEVPDVWPRRWVDTTAIPAYLQVSRDLASATKVLLGQAADKVVRTQMSGKHFKDLPEVKWQLLCDYALKDADFCYQLYKRYHNHLPQHEWDLAELTVDQADYGVQVNRTLLEDYCSSVQTQELLLLDQIPWRGDMPALSQAALRRQLITDGALDCPKSTRADDPEWTQWAEQHADRFPYLQAFVQLRRLKKHLSTLLNIQNRLDSDGVLHYSLKYCGSRLTGRWAGDAGINMQNLTKGEHFGTNIRHLFTPRNGHKFIVADLAQIEPRCVSVDTLILTQNGYIPIQDITDLETIWDGDKFVGHEGVIEKRTADTLLDIEGVKLTPDHKVFFADKSSSEAQELLEDSIRKNQARDFRGDNWKDVWLLACAVGARLKKECIRYLFRVWEGWKT